MAETSESEGNGVSGVSVVDHAVSAGVVEPRITLAYAAFETRNADPA